METESPVSADCCGGTVLGPTWSRTSGVVKLRGRCLECERADRPPIGLGMIVDVSSGVFGFGVPDIGVANEELDVPEGIEW